LDFRVYKVSMRSSEQVDVAAVASYFGGGGHIRAAGCTMQGTFYDVVNNLSAQIALQLEGKKA
jgi:phosphoesterase RecJ-like protein